MLPYSFLLFLNYQSNSHSLYPFMYLSLSFFFWTVITLFIYKVPCSLYLSILSSPPSTPYFYVAKWLYPKIVITQVFFIIVGFYNEFFYISTKKWHERHLYILYMCVCVHSTWWINPSFSPSFFSLFIPFRLIRWLNSIATNVWLKWSQNTMVLFPLSVVSLLKK